MPRKRKDDTDSEEEHESKKQKNSSPAADEESEEETEVSLPAPMLSGRLIISGGTNWDLLGRRQLPKGMKDLGGPNLWGPHIVAATKDKSFRSIISGCCAVHSVIIDTEGRAYTWGRNDKAQLGHGDNDRRDVPTEVESLSGLNIISAACGRNHTLFLSDRGQVYAVGDNKMGQLGQGHQGASVPSPTRIQYKGPPICRVACGAEFSMIVDVRGNLYSFGCPEYGQLGHNTDGKYFVKSNKMTFSCELVPRKVQVFIEKSREGHVSPVIDVEVQDVACGVNHCVALDRKKRVFTWGFGGYGRLGHSDPKDEMVPRMLKLFEGPNRGASVISAGSSYTMAVNEAGMLYLWGKNKPTGEAAMYPKPVSDLSGWKVRSLGCSHPIAQMSGIEDVNQSIDFIDRVHFTFSNSSIVVAADESIVSWGSHPTYGELALGANKAKSTSTPMEAKPFEGIYVHQVTCGFGHSLFLARTNSEEDKKNLEELPEYEPKIPGS